MSIHDEIRTLFVVTPLMRRPGWFRVEVVKAYGRNFGRPEFERSKRKPSCYKASSPEEAEEKARRAYAKRFRLGN